MFYYRIGFAVYTQVDESEIKTPRFGLLILNPEFKVGTLNPKTFESGELCRVNDFSRIRILVRGRTKMADLVVVILMANDGGRWLPHLLQVQAISYNGECHMPQN